MATIDEEISIKKRSRAGFSKDIVIVDIESDSFCSTPIKGKGKGNSKTNAISVEQYSEERDLQLAIKLSTITSDTNFIDLDNYDDGLFLLNFQPPKTVFGKRREKTKKPFSHLSITEAGELFSRYCTDCMIKYVASKLQDRITAISCPVENCGGLLEPEYCRNILPKEVFDRWGDALCEAMVLGLQSFYCPYKDCSMLLIDDGGEAVKESECPNCRRLFCAQCKVPWHAELECGEFQRLHKDEREKEDIMLMKLAKEKKWARCPNCRFVVKRTQGCRFMRCRCGGAFCYDCGTTQVDNHHHYCYNCKR
ncbi:hypothetical protein E1A91_A05G038900v1 [Gossypium mustelinum]|uniref:RBR-type E3 ubiquitin transferase n=1 Tax=Gossypium mustelinum TaxID=34275 RepID=A0A5D2Z1Q7_GOSMU|nr:hypothetical protein E1A91_A05G038900v1 [Gossypium mustelinum]